MNGNKALPLMTVVFGALINNFNRWGAGASSPAELYHAVSKNA
jgi:ATP-binding cassette subfamily B (MDR/TAP) protein 1